MCSDEYILRIYGKHYQMYVLFVHSKQEYIIRSSNTYCAISSEQHRYELFKFIYLFNKLIHLCNVMVISHRMYTDHFANVMVN